MLMDMGCEYYRYGSDVSSKECVRMSVVSFFLFLQRESLKIDLYKY